MACALLQLILSVADVETQIRTPLQACTHACARTHAHTRPMDKCEMTYVAPSHNFPISDDELCNL